MLKFRLFIAALMVVLSFELMAQERPEFPIPEIHKQVKLYPNPATEFVTIKFETPQAKKVKIALHNIIGSQVDAEIEVVDDFEVKVRVKDLSTGFYLLLVHNEESGMKGAYKFLKK